MYPLLYCIHNSNYVTVIVHRLRKRQTLNIISSGRKPIVRIVMKQKLGIQNENSTVQIIWINYLMILNIKEANETKSQKGNGLKNLFYSKT